MSEKHSLPQTAALWRRAALRHADAAAESYDEDMRMHHLLSAADCLEEAERLEAREVAARVARRRNPG